MKYRVLSLALAICLAIVPVLAGASSSEDYSNIYETAVQLAGNDLTNIDHLNYAVSLLEQLGSHMFAKMYIRYFQQIVAIQSDNSQLDQAEATLKLQADAALFTKDLAERGFPSCNQLLTYIEGRKLEAAGNGIAAGEIYRKLTILDAPDRAARLIGPKTTTDSPADTQPTIETETPQPSTSVPVLSEIYPGSKAHLRAQSDAAIRVYSYAGPGKNYRSAGGYKPSKQTEITAYYEENGWILCDIKYQTAEERVIFLPKDSFDTIGDIPSVSNPVYYNGTAKEHFVPSWGPDNRFNQAKDFSAEKGTVLKVFFRENGYAYAEYVCAEENVRMWIPEQYIDIEGTGN